MELDESMFYVNISIDKNRLKCEIVWNEFIDIDFQYAFYLLQNKVRIDTKYYTTNRTTEFELVEDAEYSVVGFVKYGDKKIIKTSENIKFKFDEKYQVSQEKFEKNPVPISIFGSCVSRDVLEFDRIKRLDLKTYIARQSIVSAVSPVLECNINDIKLESKFQREMVYNDFTKQTFERFRSDGSEYCIIDLIDERFERIKCKQGENESIVTYSSLLQESRYIENFEKLYLKKGKIGDKSYYLDTKKIDSYLEEFCRRILSIYNSKNIIIHRVTMSNFYISSSGNIKRFDGIILKNNKRINDLLNYMYNYLERNIKDARVISICDSFCADEKHKWGLAPMHYEKAYYIKVNEEIKNIVEVNN